MAAYAAAVTTTSHRPRTLWDTARLTQPSREPGQLVELAEIDTEEKLDVAAHSATMDEEDILADGRTELEGLQALTGNVSVDLHEVRRTGDRRGNTHGVSSFPSLASTAAS